MSSKSITQRNTEPGNNEVAYLAAVEKLGKVGVGAMTNDRLGGSSPPYLHEITEALSLAAGCLAVSTDRNDDGWWFDSNALEKPLQRARELCDWLNIRKPGSGGESLRDQVNEVDRLRACTAFETVELVLVAAEERNPGFRDKLRDDLPTLLGESMRTRICSDDLHEVYRAVRNSPDAVTLAAAEEALEDALNDLSMRFAVLDSSMSGQIEVEDDQGLTTTEIAEMLVKDSGGSLTLELARSRVAGAGRDGKLVSNGKTRNGKRYSRQSAKAWLLDQRDKLNDEADR